MSNACVIDPSLITTADSIEPALHSYSTSNSWPYEILSGTPVMVGLSPLKKVAG